MAEKPKSHLEHIPRRSMFADVGDVAPKAARPAVTPALEAKAERITAPLGVTKKIVTKNTGVTKNRGRPKKDATMSQADRAKAYREKRKAKA